MKHSPERDEEVFELANRVAELYMDNKDLVAELMSIAKKWRAKANMREQRIKELEEELEIIHAAINDPDNPPLTDKQLSEIKPHKYKNAR